MVIDSGYEALKNENASLTALVQRQRAQVDSLERELGEATNREQAFHSELDSLHRKLIDANEREVSVRGAFEAELRRIRLEYEGASTDISTSGSAVLGVGGGRGSYRHARSSHPGQGMQTQ